MSGNSPIIYDPATDSLYIKVRPEPSVGNAIDDDRDLVLDIGADDHVVGYDIQHAPRHPELIAQALAVLRQA